MFHKYKFIGKCSISKPILSFKTTNLKKIDSDNFHKNLKYYQNSFLHALYLYSKPVFCSIRQLHAYIIHIHAVNNVQSFHNFHQMMALILK